MIRLSVDTSFEHLALCLTRNGVVLANYYSLCHRRNSAIIFGVLDELLKNAELSLKDVDAYVINCGPGSYTGVRIGMAVVKTFAQVYKKPVIAVNSLELLAGQISKLKNDFHVLLNCTRREVFQARFRVIEGQAVAQSEIMLSTLEQFIENSRTEPVVLYRVSSERRKTELLFEQLELLELDYPVPDALILDRLGAFKMEQPEYNHDALVHPLYIKRDVEKSA